MKPKTRKFNLRDALARPDLVLVTNHPDIEIVKVEMTHDGLYPVLLTARDGRMCNYTRDGKEWAHSSYAATLKLKVETP